MILRNTVYRIDMKLYPVLYILKRAHSAIFKQGGVYSMATAFVLLYKTVFLLLTFNEY